MSWGQLGTFEDGQDSTWIQRTIAEFARHDNDTVVMQENVLFFRDAC